MDSQEEWEQVAQDLGMVVIRLLGEFDEMCRGSDHQSEAEEAVRRLSYLMGHDPGRRMP